VNNIIINGKIIDRINSLGGVYRQMSKEIKTFKNSNLENVSYYFGTYFLRSKCHSYSVFSNILSTTSYLNILKNKESIRILDIGSGIGGEFFGLLNSFEKYGLKSKKIYVDLIDANENMAKKFYEYFRYFNNEHNFKCQYNYFICDLNEKNSFSKDIKKMESLINGKYDIILSFNFINELYRVGNDEQNYKILLEECINYLKDDGLIFLSDVCDKVVSRNESNFLPIIMNRELNEFFNENKKFSPLLPIPCMLYLESCKSKTVDCFSQENYFIFKNCLEDLYDNFKVNFKIIAKKDLVSLLKVYFISPMREYYTAITSRGYNVCYNGEVKTYKNLLNNIQKAFKIRGVNESDKMGKNSFKD